MIKRIHQLKKAYSLKVLDDRKFDLLSEIRLMGLKEVTQLSFLPKG